jgi:hypothetical protein
MSAGCPGETCARNSGGKGYICPHLLASSPPSAPVSFALLHMHWNTFGLFSYPTHTHTRLLASSFPHSQPVRFDKNSVRRTQGRTNPGRNKTPQTKTRRSSPARRVDARMNDLQGASTSSCCSYTLTRPRRGSCFDQQWSTVRLCTCQVLVRVVVQ